jgi:hypothetical protein
MESGIIIREKYGFDWRREKANGEKNTHAV